MDGIILQGNQWLIPKPDLPGRSVEWQLGLTAVFVVVALAGLLYTIRSARAEGRPHLLFAFFGGGIAVLYEPLGDLLAHVTFYEAGQITLLRSFGTNVPIWMLPCYIVASGLPIVWTMNSLKNGISLAGWMKSFFIAVPLLCCLELPLLYMQAIEYYGPQPFKFLGQYPYWMAFANSAGLVFLPSAILFMLSGTRLLSRNPALMLFLTPVLVAASHAPSSLIYGLTINATRNTTMINAAAFATMIVTSVLTYIAGSLAIEFRNARALSPSNG